MAIEKDRAPLKIFVRIGALKRFHTLKQKTADLPVSVEWDRRRSDRRGDPAAAAQSDQRTHDRRGELPYTWDAADFVVVEGDASTPQRRK